MMSRIDRRSLLAGVGIATAAAAGAAQAQAGTGPSRAWGAGGQGKYTAALEAVRAYVEEHRRAYNLPGLTLCIVDDQGYTGFITSGWADVDRRVPVTSKQLFQIGSISKSLVGLCIYRLVEAGKLRLDQDIREILPDVQIDGPEKVTITHLLDHSSGLPDNAPIAPRATNNRLWLGYKPGSHWSYSNTAYDMLGKMLEKIEGKTFERICNEMALRPLGMATAEGNIRSEDRARYAQPYWPYYRDRPYGQAQQIDRAPWLDVTFAAGCVAASAEDMARYARWLIAAGQGKGAPLLSNRMAKQYTSGTVDAPGWAQPGATYGAGWAQVKIDGRTMLHHTGGMVAFSSSIHIDPEGGVGCFASTNVGSTGYRPREITSYACQLFAAARGTGKTPKPASTRIEIKDAGKYVGRFTAADGDVLEIRAGGPSGLQVVHGGAAGMLEPAGGGKFLAHHPRLGRDLLVFDPEKGRPTALWVGDREYATDRSRLRPPAKAEWRALAGRYDNDDPWVGAVRVVARPTGLFLDGATELTRLPDGSWRVGDDDWTPEKIWFDAPIGGRVQRLSFSGLDFLRRDDRA